MREEMKNVTTKELACEIVQDLLPLYHDDVVNEVTKQAVKQHLNGCEECTKEYEELCEELPKEQAGESNPQSRFAALKKRLRMNQRVKMALVALSACIVVAVLAWFAYSVPVVSVPDETFTVQAVYKVQEGDKTYLFFKYLHPGFNSVGSWHVSAELNENETTLHMNMTRCIIAPKSEIGINNCYDFVPIDSNTKKVTFAGKTIWSEEENGDKEVPEFVYELFQEDIEGADYIEQSEAGKDYVEIIYKETGKVIRWDYDGHVIYEK